MFWLHTLLGMIGEQFDEGDEICGAVVSVQAKQDKISIWTKTVSNEAAQVGIGKPWKAILDCNEKLVLPSACKQIFLLYKLPSVWMNLQKFVE
jgi:hypothetical protein